MGAEKVSLILILLTSGIFLSYTNCGKLLAPTSAKTTEATSVGNPRELQTTVLLNSICQRLTTCHTSLSQDNCRNAVLNNTDMPPLLGLPTAVFRNYSTLLTAESVGQIAGVSNSTDRCLNEIKNLECSSQAVSNAYVPDAPNPFALLSGLISTAATSSCRSSYICTEANCAPPPPVTPNPGSTSYCNYSDVTSYVAGANYACPSHGQPENTSFFRMTVKIRNTIPLYEDSMCSRPAETSGFISFDSNATGTVPISGNFTSGNSLFFELQAPQAPQRCQSVNDTPSARYFNTSSLSAWDEGTCTWLTTLPQCPP
ncbi:MAG: hypothetical protein K2X47_13530 [Bdellovibrionales bacterium]|nr:hypothetical protein [Bdellovibrionales bacterium]